MDIFSLALRITSEGGAAALGTLKQLETQGTKTGVSFDKMTGAARGFYAALTTGAVVGVLTAMVKAAAESEQSVSELRQAVQNAGASFEAWSPAMEQAAQRLMDLTKFGDEAARGALARMITTSGDVAGSLKNLGLAADFAAARHIPLEEAAQVIGRVMSGNVEMLTRYGLKVKSAGTAIEELGARFRGFAEADGRTLSGTMARIGNLAGEVAEGFGNALAGSDGFRTSAGLLEDALRGAATWIERNRDDLTKLADIGGATAHVFGFVLSGALGVLWKAFQGGQIVIVTLVAGVESLPLVFKRALGMTMLTIADFVASAGLVIDRIFGTDVVSAADKLTGAGARMMHNAVQDYDQIKHILDDTIAQIQRGADTADKAVKKAAGGLGGAGGVAWKPSIMGISLNEMDWTKDDITARAQALMKDLPPVEIPVIPDIELSAWEDKLSSAMDAFSSIGQDVVGAAFSAIGESAGRGWKTLGQNLAAGVGSAFAAVGDKMIAAGAALVTLAPWLLNIFTSGPALLAAGAVLKGLGTLTSSLANSRTFGGAGSGYAPAGGAPTFQPPPTHYIVSPGAARAAADVQPRAPVTVQVSAFGHFTPGDVRALADNVQEALERKMLPGLARA